MPTEATHVYILMRKDYRVSRNRRAAWYLSHLNQILKFTPKRRWHDLDENAELEVVSVLPAFGVEEEEETAGVGADNGVDCDDGNEIVEEVGNNDKEGNEDPVDHEGNDDKVEKTIVNVAQAPKKQYEYYVTNRTRVVFLASQYKLVVALDQSPSSAFVDIHTGQVIGDAQCDALRKSLVGITRPFRVPGTKLTFRPKIYLRLVSN